MAAGGSGAPADLLAVLGIDLSVAGSGTPPSTSWSAMIAAAESEA
jgi:hypothetical protein